MKYDIDSLKGSYRKRYGDEERIDFLFFCSGPSSWRGPITGACLSQLCTSPFTVDGETYLTAEHWMMFQKAILFGDAAVAQEIIRTKSPADVKSLGRKIKGFEEKFWDERKFEIVLQGNYHKFSQNESLFNFLVSTDTTILAEANPVDKIWGIGMSQEDPDITNPCLWQGENLLGFVLMEVRDLLKVNDENRVSKG